ncbi:MAG: hypothetical protein H6564_16910 [Lewinellaceae bacterium]|nr:hypothetical protein [Lewinellaceae bacterium]
MEIAARWAAKKCVLLYSTKIPARLGRSSRQFGPDLQGIKSNAIALATGPGQSHLKRHSSSCAGGGFFGSFFGRPKNERRRSGLAARLPGCSQKEAFVLLAWPQSTEPVPYRQVGKPKALCLFGQFYGSVFRRVSQAVSRRMIAAFQKLGTCKGASLLECLEAPLEKTSP